MLRSGRALGRTVRGGDDFHLRLRHRWVEAISRLIHPQMPTHLLALGAAGLIGFAGNWIAAGIRTRADSYVSLAVVGSAIVVALGLPIADPLIASGSRR